MGSLSGGHREGLCARAAGHATDRCVQPRGRHQEGSKAAERQLEEVNYCARGHECLFDEKGYMVTLLSPNVLGGHVQEKNKCE